MLFGTLSFFQTVSYAIVFYLVGWIIYCRYFHPLRSIPGPFLASISRAWVVFMTAKGDIDRTQRALHKKRGYLVRVAPNEVSCSDPEAIKIIYGTKNVFTKSDYYNAWVPPNNGYSGHFSTRDEKAHSERRRIVNNIYSMTSVLESEDSIDSCTEEYCEFLSQSAKQKSPVDLGLWNHRYAFDVLGELFFGRKFGFMGKQSDVGGYMKTIDSLLPAFTIAGVMPSYFMKIYLASTILFSPSVRGALGSIEHMEKAARAAVGRRKQEMMDPNDNKCDMLRKMLDINAERGEKINFNIEHVCVESQSSLFAGADTTSIALNSVFYHLMRKPAAYNKLTAEIDSAIAYGRLSLPVSYAGAIKLPYLKACINEGMRLHPSVGLTMPRNVPAGGAVISDFFFPAGYRIGINGAVVQYDTDVFGPDAEVFNPDRWIHGDPARMERTMIQFGSGPRVCIGKNISLSEIYKLVPQIVRLFKLRLVQPSEEWSTSNYWFHNQSGINVYIDERGST